MIINQIAAGGGGEGNVEVFYLWHEGNSAYKGVYPSQFPTKRPGTVKVFGSGVSSSNYRYQFHGDKYTQPYASGSGKPSTDLEITYDGDYVRVPIINSASLKNVSLCFVKEIG